MYDASIIRLHRDGTCIADNNYQDMGRSRGGLTSKIHAVVDANGLPVHLALTPGEAHDNRLCSVLLSALLPKTMLLADRGYDADWIRELARQQGAWANIPPKRNRKDPICFSPYLYRARNLIERFFNKIKQCRRVATRYDKLAANYLAFIKLASIRIWLRSNEATPNVPRTQRHKRVPNAIVLGVARILELKEPILIQCIRNSFGLQAKEDCAAGKVGDQANGERHLKVELRRDFKPQSLKMVSHGAGLVAL